MVVALLTFLAAATLVIVAPGPDTLLVTRNVFRRGRRGGLVTAAGTVTGLALWSVAAALGLSALLAASRVGYDVVRVAGGLYLIWLASRACAHTGWCPLRRRRPRRCRCTARISAGCCRTCSTRRSACSS
jgi:threonine/homoserine/homoserine lactone efflux protein